MSEIVQKRTKQNILIGLGGVALGLGLFAAVTWFGIGFRYRRISIPDLVPQILGVLFVLGGAFVALMKSEACSRCGAELDDADTEHEGGLESKIADLASRGDIAGLLALPRLSAEGQAHVSIHWGGCADCGEVASLRIDRVDGNGNTTTGALQILSGDPAKAVSAFVGEQGESE